MTAPASPNPQPTLPALPPLGSKRRIVLESILASRKTSKAIPLAVEYIDPASGDEVCLDCTFTDPSSPAVLARYHQTKAEAGDDAASLQLWVACKVGPAELTDPAVASELPTGLKVAITQTLLGRLGNELFTQSERKAFVDAAVRSLLKEAPNLSSTPLAISAVTLPGSNGTPPTPSAAAATPPVPS